MAVMALQEADEDDDEDWRVLRKQATAVIHRVRIAVSTMVHLQTFFLLLIGVILLGLEGCKTASSSRVELNYTFWLRFPR